MRIKVTDIDDDWTPLTPGKPISGGSEDNGKAASGDEKTAQYDTSNKKKRFKMKKHRPRIYDDSKPNKVSTPETPKPVASNRVQKKSKNSEHNSTNYSSESCKPSLNLDDGKSDNSGKIATVKRNLPRSCRFRTSLEASQNLSGCISETSNLQQDEENGRQEIQVYKRHSKFTPAFEVYNRTIKENCKATTLGEQKAAQYDAVKVPNSEWEGEKSRCGHESGADIKESRKRHNEGLDMNKKRPRMTKDNLKIYDDSQLNKVSNFQASNSLSSPKTTTTPKTPKPATPKRVQIESCKRSLDFGLAKFDTSKRVLPRRNCRNENKSLEASQSLLGDISRTGNEKQGEEDRQKYFHVYRRCFSNSSKAICLTTPAFDFYQRRIAVHGRKDIQVYKRRCKINDCLQYIKRPRLLRKKPNTNRWYVKEHEEGKNSIKKVENAITVPKEPVVKPNVDLDSKSLVVWKMLMANGGSERVDNDKDGWWREQGEKFGRRMDSFLGKMRDVQGDMRFSPWKGSVTDSVVGAYLTQNVTDHLSSSAFMSVAARYPPRSRNETLGFHDVFASSSSPRASRTTKTVPKKSRGSRMYDSNGELISKKEKKKKENRIEWEELRKSSFGIGETEVDENHKDSVDWNEVRLSPVTELSETIADRGMQHKLAKRIKVDFLERIYKEHGSLDLEWLRNVPPHKAKEFLLSFFGLGLKSVECIRLLTLHHLAFPVDTNVARVATRLGWVPLQSLPDHVPIHLLNAYPPFNNIQKYLFPRLCTLDKEKLYELHCHLITFGKVFCSKKKPNCVACPMKGECLHYASAFPSHRLGISGPTSSTSIIPVSGSTCYSRSSEPTIEEPLSPKPEEPEAEDPYPVIDEIEDLCNPQRHFTGFTIVEVPPSPEPRAEKRVPSIADIEDLVYESDDNDDGGDDESVEHENGDFVSGGDDSRDREDEMSQALAPAPSEEALSVSNPKKFSAKWRTMHLVYELPDNHPCLAGFEAREPEDPTPYLLALWFPGEDRNLPKYVHNRAYIANKDNGDEKVQATVLIPCRTATRGSFPLNGTYFQVNEVFADEETSRVPLKVPRHQLVDLKIRILGCGTSTSSIYRDLSYSAIQRLFCEGSICVRGFDRRSRQPRPLHVKFHTTRKGVAAAAEE